MQNNNMSGGTHGDMTERYKEEMMKLYRRTRNNPPSNEPVVSSALNTPEEPAPPAAMTAPRPPRHLSELSPEISSELSPESVAQISSELSSSVRRFEGGIISASPETAVNNETGEPDTAGRFPPARELIERAMMQQQSGETPAEPREPGRTQREHRTTCDNTEEDNTGVLQVEVSSGSNAVPIIEAAVIVKRRGIDSDSFVCLRFTDRSGKTDDIELPAPETELSLKSETADVSFSMYLVSVYKNGYFPVIDLEVPVFAKIKSIQPVMFIPEPKFEKTNNEG